MKKFTALCIVFSFIISFNAFALTDMEMSDLAKQICKEQTPSYVTALEMNLNLQEPAKIRGVIEKNYDADVNKKSRYPQYYKKESFVNTVMLDMHGFASKIKQTYPNMPSMYPPHVRDFKESFPFECAQNVYTDLKKGTKK